MAFNDGTPVATGDQIVTTSTRLFSEEVEIARMAEGEDVLKSYEAEVAYEFAGGKRKFKNSTSGL